MKSESASLRKIILRPSLTKLVTNHMDAWGVAMVISLLALVIHDGVSWNNLPILIAISGSYWFGFAYNDYQDATYDALDEQKKHDNFFVHTLTCQRNGCWLLPQYGAVPFWLVRGLFSVSKESLSF